MEREAIRCDTEHVQKLYFLFLCVKQCLLKQVIPVKTCLCFGCCFFVLLTINTLLDNLHTTTHYSPNKQFYTSQVCSKDSSSHLAINGSISHFLFTMKALKLTENNLKTAIAQTSVLSLVTQRPRNHILFTGKLSVP